MHEDAITFDAWLIPGCVQIHTPHIRAHMCASKPTNVYELQKV